MKKACLVLVLLTSLISCETDTNSSLPDKLPLKTISATSSAGNYNVVLTYGSGNQLVSYAASNGMPSFKFTYNNDGLPSVIEETIGTTKTEYTINYDGVNPEWASSRIMQGSSWVNGPDYEYTVESGSVTEISQFVKGTQTKIGSVTAEYQSHFMNKITSNIIGNAFSKTYVYSHYGAVNTSKRINLLTPNMPAHLVSLFVADTETNGNVTTSFTYGY